MHLNLPVSVDVCCPSPLDQIQLPRHLSGRTPLWRSAQLRGQGSTHPFSSQVARCLISHCPSCPSSARPSTYNRSRGQLQQRKLGVFLLFEFPFRVPSGTSPGQALSAALLPCCGDCDPSLVARPISDLSLSWLRYMAVLASFSQKWSDVS